jgi:hypothetical protein
MSALLDLPVLYYLLAFSGRLPDSGDYQEEFASSSPRATIPLVPVFESGHGGMSRMHSPAEDTP